MGMHLQMHSFSQNSHPPWRHFVRYPFSACILALQVLASFLVQDLEAEGLNPFLLTYIANSLFIVYLPIYVIVKRLTYGQKGRQAALQSVLPFKYAE